MRELFDEVAGQSQLDPEEAVRRATRTPQRKRFYKAAGFAEAEGGFAVTLDGKPIRTPSGRQVEFPVDTFSKHCLVEGVDELGYILNQQQLIAAFERTHPAPIDTLA